MAWRSAVGTTAVLSDVLDAIDADTLALRLLDDTYTDDDADNFLDATSGAAIADVPLTGAAMSAFTITADDPSTGALADGDLVRSFVVYIDSGTESTSRILWFVDRKADSTLILIPTNGGELILHFQAGRIASL